MKINKKTLALVLALVACFGLFAGCGEKPAVSDTDIPENEGQETEITDISDFDYISGKGKIVIGYTDYAPMNYTDDEGVFTGFDTELAEAVCEKLGLTPEFVEINWDTKEIELEAKSIDCIWNGLTITPARQAAMSISEPYVKNAQVVIVKKGSGITGTADLIGKTVVAEVSSAGEMQILGDDENEPEENLAQAKYVAVNYQKDCLLEVKSGTADAAVLDWTLAMTMIGEGTSYEDLEMIEGLELATEEYGIAFRKDSDITEKVNAALRELVADGTLPALAEKYGLSLAPAIS